jgi:hypothetical protein
MHLPVSHSKRSRSYIPTTPPDMPSLPARHASSASQPVPPKPHRRPVALFPPDSDEDEYDLPGLVTTKRSVEKATAVPSNGSDEEEDTEQKDHEEDTAQTDNQEDSARTDNEEDTAQTDNEDDDDDEEVTKKAFSSKGRAGATNLTPTQWAVIVSMD